jgi:hypothetical protein
MKIGSEMHKELFCRSFIDSHQLYEPENLPWPQLDGAALDRLRSIPFWEEALDTERQAGVMVSAFAATVSDPLIREAISLQGQEEARHARLLEYMIRHYDIRVSDRPAAILPANLEPEFIDFGYGECLDSFLAFGVFAIARQSAFFPEPLFAIFSPLLDEEARHIVFLVNWVAYLETMRGRGARPIRALNSLLHYGKALYHLYGIVNAPDNGGAGFTATGASEFTDNLTLELFLSSCLEENARRMSSFDQRLLQPQLMPSIAAPVLNLVRGWSRLTSTGKTVLEAES